jgi:hypothetical protein
VLVAGLPSCQVAGSCRFESCDLHCAAVELLRNLSATRQPGDLATEHRETA